VTTLKPVSKSPTKELADHHALAKKPAALPTSSRLNPSEIESLRQETKRDMAKIRQMLDQ